VNIVDPVDGSRGAVVTTVEPGTPADDAALQPGDLVTVVDERPVDGAAAFAAAVRAHRPGDDVALMVARDGAERQMRVSLSSAG
jgi:S1-C subfamily serine protease